MGTEARIVLYAPSRTVAESAATAAFARIAALDAALSDYRTDSELARLSAASGGAARPVSNDLYAVLRVSLDVARASDGAFDVTVGPLVRLWRAARTTKRLPSTADRCAAIRLVGWRAVELDSASRTARLKAPGMSLDFGGIAKGYAADEAIAALRTHGVSRALVLFGGDIVASGAPPGASGWTVFVKGADSAHRTVTIENRAISSSGDAEQFVEIGGVRYSHVVDPRTGFGLTSGVTATVLAPTGMQADAWATAVSVMDSVQRAGFVAAHPQGSFYVRARQNGRKELSPTPPCPRPGP